MPQQLIKNITFSLPSLIKHMPLQERYESIIHEAVNVVGATSGSIFINEDGYFKRVYTNVPRNFRFNPRKKGFTEQSFETGKVIIMSPTDLAGSHGAYLKKGVQSVILIPLITGEKKVGVLTLQMKTYKEFTPEQVQVLDLFGTLATLSIQNSQYLAFVEQSIQNRDRFISLASHELKTPLTTVLVYADLMHRKTLEKKPVPTDKMYMLLSEARRLKKIIDELLAFEQITSGELKYEWEEIHIRNIINKSIASFNAMYPQYKVVFTSKVKRNAGRLIGDPDKMQQVFTNLFTNSAKFSSAYVPIVVELTQLGHELYITVSDFGKGIKKSEQKKIFTEFYRGSHGAQGLGLGLALVKSIIEKHKGSVQVKSKLHKGSSFLITLPLET